MAQRFLYDKIVRDGTLTPLVSTDYHPSHPITKIQNIWSDYYYRSKYGANSGWGVFEITDTNKYIDFNEGGGELTAILTTGTYDATSLCTEIKTRMDAVGGLTYTITYSDTSNKFTIAGSGAFTILWQSGTNSANSVGDTIGYNVTADDTGGSSYPGDYPRIHSAAAVEIESYDQSAITTIGCALFGLNLLSAYQILKLQRYTGSAWEDIGNFEYDSTNKRAIIFFTQKSASKYRVYIRDRENPLGYIQVGAFLLGDYQELSVGYEYGAVQDLDDVSPKQYSKKGYVNITVGYEMDVEAVEYTCQSADETKMETVWNNTLKRYPLVFVRDASQAKQTMKYILFRDKFRRVQEDAYTKVVTLMWEKAR